MSIEARLNKLVPVLSAKERAVLVLGSFKDGKPEDPSWRATMPREQAADFSRLIGLMNVANIQLGAYILVLEQRAGAVELREDWLVTIQLWEEHTQEIERAVRLSVREPVTRSDYQALLTAARNEWVPVAELAALAAGDYDGWAEDDFEELEGRDEPTITKAAWERVCAEKERGLRQLVAEGKLAGRGRGTGLRVQQGAFDDLVGRASGVAPERLLAFRIVPDEEAEDARREKRSLDLLLGTLDWKPPTKQGDEDVEMNLLQSLHRGLGNGLCHCLAGVWVDVRATEIVIDELAAEFDGVDPLKPKNRRGLEEARQRLLKVRDELVYLGVELALPEPDDEALETLREVVRRWTGWYST